VKSELHAIFVHGVGQQKSGFSAHAQRKLAAALKLRGITLHAQEVLWAPVLDKLEAQMLRDVGKLGSANNAAQKLTVGTLADALAYPNRREAILDLADAAFARLRSNEVHIFAHSLGVVVATDWLRSRPPVNATLTSFGANIALFNLGGTFVCPNQLRAERRWRNAFYASDFLGFPLRGFQEQVDDIRLTKPFWSKSTIIPGLSHLDYWQDSRLWSSTIPGGF
jgi:hypothetical protein